jgi:4-hydroxy-3-methylbut-2-enyl diphosphate reductase
MCFGVRDAIALALGRAESAPLTILGDLVHNEAVLDRLREHGIGMVGEPADAPAGAVLITAHGASNRTLQRVQALGHEVIEATCPLVHVAHHALRSLVHQGYHPVVIGRRDHVEVRGLTEDLDEFDVVIDERDIEALRERPRFGVVAQTTHPIDAARHLVSAIRRRFPSSEVHFIDTVCLPTKQRQDAAVDLARASDVVIVVGGAASNNTRQLVNTCGRHCPRVYQVQTEADVLSSWLEHAETVGITAGTSTPDDVIDRVESRVLELSARGSAIPGGEIANPRGTR